MDTDWTEASPSTLPQPAMQVISMTSASTNAAFFMM
jgi:hypothetical protein